MVIKEFSALNFRNFPELAAGFSAGVNLIVGQNGQGKTNLAEGIFFLCHLDSFRTHHLEQLPAHGQTQAFLQGGIEMEGLPHKARVEVSRRGRRAWLDEVPVRRLSAYAAHFHALVFNPDSLFSYRNYPGERRHVFDRLLSFLEPEYLESLRGFRAAHAQKNALLKQGVTDSLPEWNRLFVERGHAMMKARGEMAARLNEMIPGVYGGISGKKPPLHLRYLPSLSGDPVKDLVTLERAAGKEQRAGYALHGPHRDDYELMIDGERGETYLSQGEYRVALLALKLAMNGVLRQKRGFRPVLILDDLYSELDQGVRARFNAHLEGVDNQVFITTTEPPGSVGLADMRIMEIRAGQIL